VFTITFSKVVLPYPDPRAKSQTGDDDMFKVFLDGTYHSTHTTFTNACREARVQASVNQNAYFTVFEAGDEAAELLKKEAEEVMVGVPDYIIFPQTRVSAPTRKQPQPVVEQRRASTVRVRSHAHSRAVRHAS
jgi:uncharacterized short protein YbdD (DUF466 family)